MRSRAFALLFVLCISLSSGFAEIRTSPQIISIVQLLASPDKYEGKQVVVFGFLTIGQENNRLYLGKTDYDNVLLTNSIWIQISDDMLARQTELNKKYVRVEGVFHKEHAGMPTDYVGGITEVSKCKAWSDPEHPLSEKIQKMVR